MRTCDSIDPLVTPFVDGTLAGGERDAVEAHVGACPPCHSRVTAERAVKELLRERRGSLCNQTAPDALHVRCMQLAANDDQAPGTRTSAGTENGERRTPNAERRRRSSLVPLAMAASLVAVVGGAFTYQATSRSSRVLAAELVADHAKCFALNGALGTHEAAAAVEQSMAASFDWRVHLPANAPDAGLELVGARQCLYGEGRAAHIMYMHQGHPVSLFMLPQGTRTQELVEVLGHEAAIWCDNSRTFVLVAREPRREVERMASFVQAGLH